MYVGMSDEELIGKAGVEYRDAKRKLASLESECRQYIDQFKGAIEAISHPPAFGSGPNAPDSIPEINLSYPEPDRVERLIRAIIQHKQAIALTRAELVRHGINVE